MTVDTFSKMAHFVPLKGLPSEQELVVVFAKEVFHLHGIPKRPRAMLKLQFILLAVCHMHGIHSAWDVMYPDKVQTVRGSCLLIPCTFSYPSDISASSGIVMIWYKDYESSRKVVYHSNNANDALFHDRVHMLGDYNAKNCTVLINNIRNEDAGVYHFRFEIKNANQWSAVRGVTVTVTDEPIIPEVVFPSPIVEEQNVTFQCSTPYFCPDGSVVLGWEGYATKRSFLSGNVQLDTSGILNEQNLATRFSWMDNQKVIRCEVSVGPQKAVKDVALIVEHAPKEVSILMKPSGKNIKQGDNVTLTCHVNSSYPAGREYTWYRNKELTFTRSIPAITSVSPSSEVREGQNVTLTCDVPGATPEEVHYSWYKNSILIKEITTRSLLFSEVTVSDIGYYNCRIQNDKGSDSSPPITLNVLYTPRVPALNSFLETQEGKLAIIECKVDSNPVSELMLYKNGILITTTTSQGAINQRINVISTQNSLKLEIRDVMLSNEGTYRCTAKNDIGNSTAILQLTVESARVGISPSSETEEGKEVTLTCLATRSSQKDVTYTWYKNGKWLKKDSVRNTIIFHRVSTQDAGSYYCIVQSSQGTSSSPPRTLHVFFPPKDLSITSLVSTKGKNMGFILCTVESDPHSELFIYRKESLVASSTKVLSNRKYIVSSSTNSLKLEIRDVLIEDEGTYTCIANNTYGQTTGSLDFATETAKLIVLPSSEVREEDTVNVTCMLSSDSEEGTYTYTWYKNSDWYSEGPEHYLVFRRIKSSDSGSYSCRVWNNETSKSSAMVGLNVACVRIPRPSGRCHRIPNPSRYSILPRSHRYSGKTEPSFFAAGHANRNDSICKRERASAATFSTPGTCLARNDRFNRRQTNTRRRSKRKTGRDDAVKLLITSTTPKLSQWNTTHLFRSESPQSSSATTMGNNSRNTKLHPTRPNLPNLRPHSTSRAGPQLRRSTCRIHRKPLDISSLLPSTPPDWHRIRHLQLDCNISDPTTGRTPGAPPPDAAAPPEGPAELPALSTSTDTGRLAESDALRGEKGPPGVPDAPSPRSPWTTTSSLPCEIAEEQTSISHPTQKPLPPGCAASPNITVALTCPDELRRPEPPLSTSARGLPPHEAARAREGRLLSLSGLLSGRDRLTPSLPRDPRTRGSFNCLFPRSPDPFAAAAMGLLLLLRLLLPSGLRRAGGRARVFLTGRPDTAGPLPEPLPLAPAFRILSCSRSQRPPSSSATRRSWSINSADITDLPRNTQLKSFLDTEEGKTAFIQCTVESYPPAEMLLYRNNILLLSSSNHSYSNPRYSVSISRNTLKLDILNVKMEDEGKYTCNSTNFIGSTSETIYFNVQSGRILVSPSPDINEEEKVTLTCQITKSQTRYTWYKNSRFYQETSDNTLVFDKIKARDSGYYYCRAWGSEDNILSPSVSLHVSYAPREPILSSFWESDSGHVGIIQCSVDSDPPSRLSLFRRETLVGSTDSSRSSNKRMTVSSSENLLKVEIRDVMLEDEGDYLCSASNSIGNSSSMTSFTAQTTRIQISPSSVVPEGIKVNLTCVVSTDAPDKVTYGWYKNGNKYPGAATKTLVFGTVSSEDGGSYYCTVQSDKGSKSSSSVTLSVTYAPRNAFVQSFLETKNGNVAIILCAVDSNPPAEMTLYKDLHLVASSDSSGMNYGRFNPYFSSNALRLEINNLIPSDEGTYTFTAKNFYGTTTASVNFTVGGARVSVSPSSELQEGYSVTLTCEVLTGAQPVVTYTWYKNGRWFQDGSAGSLVFGRVRRSDGGSYSCTAHTSKDSWTSPPTTLYVLYSPRNLTLTSFLETQTRRLGVILCSVNSEPPSDLSLYKGDQVMASSDSNSFSHHVKLSVSRNSLRLEIYEMTMEDQGEYVCRANNSLGESEKSMYFSVQTARLVAVPSTEVQEGAAVTLICEIVSQEERSYVWYKNSKWLKEGPEASLVLLNVTSSDAGSYHCQANHEGQNSISPLVGIHVLYAPRNAYIRSFLETKNGHVAIIVCAVDSNPPSEITLYKDHQLLASSDTSGRNLGRFNPYFSSNTLRLEISNLMPSDEGTYQFTAKNVYGTSTASMNFIMGGARVLVSPASELQEGYSVTLTCEVLTGLQPVVAYTWYKNSRWFQEGSAGSLVFERVSRNDGGSYSCTAHSSKDSWTSSPSTLYVLYSPRNLSLTSFLETQTRRLGVILCSVDSEPPSDLSLYKGDQVMASSDFSSFSHHVKPSVSRNSLRLEIYEMTMEDQVEYVCRANNSLGESEKSIYFSVQTARLVVSPSAEVQEGATVTLTCEISSREESSYVWYKNNKWLKESSEAFLVLLRVTSSDAGSYHCQAKTGGQNSISPLVGIKVLYSPRNVLIKSFLETHGREQAIIMCSVSSEPASVIGLYRRDVLLASSMEVQPDQGQKLWSLSSHNYLKLEIRDIGAEDSGSYVCIANNTLGTAISSTLLNINGKHPQFLSFSPFAYEYKQMNE
ncbi:sialoadhesin [Rhinophrynus dorsalis]